MREMSRLSDVFEVSNISEEEIPHGDAVLGFFGENTVWSAPGEAADGEERGKIENDTKVLNF